MGDKKSKKGFCSHQFQFNHIIIIFVIFFCLPIIKYFTYFGAFIKEIKIKFCFWDKISFNCDNVSTHFFPLYSPQMTTCAAARPDCPPHSQGRRPV